MTETDLITAPAEEGSADSAASGAASKSRTRTQRTGLTGMVLTELRAVAGELGIKGTSGMRKGDLIAAIKERQAGAASANGIGEAEKKARRASAPKDSGAPEQMTLADSAGTGSAGTGSAGTESGGTAEGPTRRRRGGAAQAETARSESADPAAPTADKAVDKSTDKTADRPKADGDNRGQARSGDAQSDSRQGDGADGNEQRNRNRNRNQGGGNQNSGNQNSGNQNSGNQNSGNQNSNQGGNGPNNGPGNQNRDDDGDGSGRGRRGRRFRERRRGRDRGDSAGEPQVSEDDVLQPVAGILDVLDNYAFVRTSGYLAGPNDVYVSMNLVRKNGLRRGDAITGAVKVPREGEQQNQRQKFNPLVRLDTVNGGDVEAARKRPEFGKLTPLYPNQRLRLETTPERLDTRVIDLIMPIGKGQRALIVSPPKAGKTTILQDIANAITINTPECHLMVVLVDERPEEVTDMQRSVKGEVIASTFDRPPSDHTSVAELAIERAKRLVESGKDVVVLLDSITRLGRAYNNASPASGRILSGGVDSTALYPPKRFLGAARNIENGGSLTIIASALVETGSTGDTVIFEEFKGTGNAELKLDRKIADRRVFPAVDVNQSSTRKDELMMSPEEFSIMHKLRRVLSGLDSQQAIDLLLSQLKKTKTNVEFLMQVQSNAPGAMKDD